MQLNVLVIGGGAREHALVAAIKASPRAQVWCAPGNAGIAELASCVKVQPDDLQSMLTLVKEFSIDLTVVGPENPLAAGIVDAWEEHGYRIFGPRRDAAMLEASKVWAKKFMSRHDVPTAGYRIFTDYSKAREFVKESVPPLVIKADGLAAGKGVIVAEDESTALEALDRIMRDEEFGEAGREVVIEEFLEGDELSVLAVTDGETIIMTPPAQDHKRIWDGDRGPNTGGMGAYSPVPVAGVELVEDVRKRIIEPTIRGMASEGRSYRGVLYAGLMITSDGPKVLEFNVRFGDPETQVLLPLYRGSFLDMVDATCQGKLHQHKARWSDEAAACVVLAAEGYPGPYEKGIPIDGIDEALASGVEVFHAGTARREGQFVTAGGRVLSVVGKGADLQKALERAYSGVASISFSGMHYRRDIGARALAY